MHFRGRKFCPISSGFIFADGEILTVSDELRLLCSLILFIVFIVEKKQVVAKLLNLSKSIIYNVVNIMAKHNSTIILFQNWN